MIKRFPLYKQLDQMDCGPTCLRMIAKYYGKSYSLSELRNKAFISKEGVSLFGISDAAEAIGFRTLGILLTLEKLNDASVPCIVHWNQNHFVVVYKVSKKKIYTADPSGGYVEYTPEEFLKSWATRDENGVLKGVALLLEATPEFYNMESETTDFTKDSISYLFSYFRSYKKYIVQLLIGLLLGSLIQLSFPFLTQSIVDVGINTRNIHFVYLILIAQLMLVVGKTAVEFIRRWILLFLSTRINISILSDFLTKLVQLPISFFDQKMIGDLLKRVDDHSRVERFLSTSSLNMIFSFFNLVIFGVVLVIYSLPVFFIFFGCSVVYVLYIVIFMRKRKELDYKHFSQMAQNQANLIQLIQGMQEIKLNTCERQKRWEWEKIQAKLFSINLKSTTLQQYQEAGGLFINEFKNIFVAIIASQAVINGDMTLGMMMAITYIVGQLNGPINEFIAFLRDYQDAKISLERIGEIHALENENTSALMPGDGNDVPNFIQPVLSKNESENGLTLVDVTFRYGSPQTPPVLDNINLFIPEGKVTAIVGVSGSGKTTLLKLLLKFYAATSGDIRLSGTNLKMFTHSDWRKKCGAVMQDGYIFFDTIARNIAMSDEVIDPDKLLQAVTTANIRDFVEGLPLGYNTKIGEDGVGYSQGQKQRLMIARAVYKNPQYLFFDEATSSLDANNERVIMENLNEFFKGRTVVIIAHRLSTVKNADQIVVLDRGKIVEVGNHETLVASRGSYFALVKNQLELGN